VEREKKVNTAFTQQDIEQHLKSALAASTPDIWPELEAALKAGNLSAEALPDQKSVFESVGKKFPKSQIKATGFKKFQKLGAAIAACLCLAAAGGSYYHYAYLQVVSQVEIDVNPSLRLFLNRKEQVLKAQALNEDGEGLINSSSLKGQSVQDAVNQVVDSLVEKGYLERETGEYAVLVSVSGNDRKAAEQIKAAVTSDVEAALAQKEVKAVVYDQVIQITEELEELAETYQVSLGKAEFIGQLVQENLPLNENQQDSYSRMMGQTMEELTQEIDQNSYQIGSGVTVIKTSPALSSKEVKDGNERSGDWEKGNSSQTLPERWRKPDDEKNTENSNEKKGQEERESAIELSEIGNQRDSGKNPSDDGEKAEDRNGEDSSTKPVKSGNPADDKAAKDNKTPENSREREDNGKIEDPEEYPDGQKPADAKKPEDDGNSIGSKSTAGDGKPADNGGCTNGETKQKEEEDLNGSKQNQESENPEEPSVQAQGELEKIEAPENSPLSKAEEETKDINAVPETGNIHEELKDEDVPKESNSIKETEETQAADNQSDQDEKEDPMPGESQTEPEIPDKNPSMPEQEIAEETLPSFEEEIPEESDQLSGENNPEESRASSKEESAKEDRELSKGESAEESKASSEKEPEEESRDILEEIAQEEDSSKAQMPSQEHSNPEEKPFQQEQIGSRDKAFKEEMPLFMGIQKKRSDTEASSDEGEGDLPERKGSNQIIHTPSEEIDTFEPGDLAGEREEGLTTTSSGTTIIFEAVEEKEWKEPVYASQLLTGSERSLLQMGPGVFAGLLSAENPESLLQLGPGFLCLYGDSMKDLEAAYFLGVRIMPLQGWVYPLEKQNIKKSN
jgi:hypothetical protein